MLIISVGATIHVPKDYNDIQVALDHAHDGDIIVISSGYYKGFTVSKSVTIIGESYESVIIRGTIVISASNVKISNVKVVLNESTGGSTAVIIKGLNTVLTNIAVESYRYGVQVGTAVGGAGAVIEYSSIRSDREAVFGSCESLSIFHSVIVSVNGNAVSYCGVMDIENNEIMSRGIGLRIGGSLSEGNIARGNKITVAGDAAGIYVDGNKHLVMNNKLFNGGIEIRGGSNIIKYNFVAASSIGINLVGNYNIVEDNIISAGDHAIDLYGSSNKILNNTLSGGRGIHGLNGNGNVIAFNFINRTGNIGVYMSKYTSQNTIYGNTFWYCYNYDAADESGRNTWYNETIKLGNYWSNNKAPDLDGDGITDQPYHIATTTNLEIIDKYPLAKPLTTPNQIITTSRTPTSTPTATLTLITQSSPSSEGEYTNTQAIFVAVILIGVLAILILIFRRSHRYS